MASNEFRSSKSTPSRPGAKELLRVAAGVGAPFFVGIVYLALHRASRVPRVKEIAYERTLILNLLLYWLIATLLWTGVRHRAWLRARFRAFLPRLLLLAFSTLISLAFAEVALRILRPHTAAQPFERLASETLHHKNAADRRSMGMGNQWVETNSDGFRTAHERQSFAELDHRIVLLGDSFTFGLGVAEEDAVAAILEDRLSRELKVQGRNETVGVLNTGVISYSPLLERQAFREVVRHYRPTVTLLLVDANDIGDDYQYSRENVSGDLDQPRWNVPPMQDKGPGLCARSALCRSLGPVWQRLTRPKQVLWKLLGFHQETYDYYAFEAEVGDVVEKNRFFILRHPLEATREYFDRSWGFVQDVAEDSRGEGAPFVLVVMPRYFHWNDEECPDNWESDRYGVDEPHENVFLDYFDERAKQGAGFPVWSLLRPFENHSRQSGETMVFDHDPHWNANGHRVAGEALAAWLTEAGWPEGDLAAAGPRLSFETSADPAAEGEGATGAEEIQGHPDDRTEKAADGEGASR